jgi:MFS family permease
MLSSAIFCIGVLIETINTHSIDAFYVGRVVAGVGLGAATVVVPMSSSEMAPRELRRQIGSFFQWFYTFGIYLLSEFRHMNNFSDYHARHFHLMLG